MLLQYVMYHRPGIPNDFQKFQRFMFGHSSSLWWGGWVMSLIAPAFAQFCWPWCAFSDELSLQQPFLDVLHQAGPNSKGSHGKRENNNTCERRLIPVSDSETCMSPICVALWIGGDTASAVCLSSDSSPPSLRAYYNNNDIILIRMVVIILFCTNEEPQNLTSAMMF